MEKSTKCCLKKVALFLNNFLNKLKEKGTCLNSLDYRGDWVRLKGVAKSSPGAGVDADIPHVYNLKTVSSLQRMLILQPDIPSESPDHWYRLFLCLCVCCFFIASPPRSGQVLLATQGRGDIVKKSSGIGRKWTQRLMAQNRESRNCCLLIFDRKHRGCSRRKYSNTGRYTGTI